MILLGDKMPVNLPSLMAYGFFRGEEGRTGIGAKAALVTLTPCGESYRYVFNWNFIRSLKKVT